MSGMLARSILAGLVVLFASTGSGCGGAEDDGVGESGLSGAAGEATESTASTEAPAAAPGDHQPTIARYAPHSLIVSPSRPEPGNPNGGDPVGDPGDDDETSDPKARPGDYHPLRVKPLVVPDVVTDPSRPTPQPLPNGG